uniref:Uncharacterized protein n=1 Tax=Anguilla anguilla TaxID=7936 RepID=A0A0E9WHS3_ANGAN
MQSVQQATLECQRWHVARKFTSPVFSQADPYFCSPPQQPLLKNNTYKQNPTVEHEQFLFRCHVNAKNNTIFNFHPVNMHIP